MPIATWNTSSWTTDLAKKSFSGFITSIAPNGQSPLYGLTSMLKEETAYQPEHGYFSKTMIFPSFTLNGAVISTATAFTVQPNTDILVGMIFQNPTTRENVLVTAVGSSTTLTVVRGFGDVAAAAGADASVWYLAGNAFEEASVRPSSMIILPTRVINYTQIFRNTWAVSGTAAATGVIAGAGADAESKKDCAMFHAVDIERALIWGQAFVGTRNNFPIRTMRGLISFVVNNAAGNVTTLGATTNWTQLEAALDPVFQQTTNVAGPNERLALVGGNARRVLHNIFRLNSQYMINDQVTEWGLQFDAIKIPRGRFNLVEHSLFNAFGSSSTFARMMLAVDLASFGMAYMTGRKTTNREFNLNGQIVDNGIDAVGGSLLTEATCLVKNPAANAVVYNFTSGVAG